MSLYTIVANPLLSAKALVIRDAEPEKFAALVDLAEQTLQIPDYTDDPVKLPMGAMAVTLQLNWQLERNTDALLYRSDSAGQQSESVTYRDQDQLLLSPEAEAILDALALDDSPVVVGSSLAGRYMDLRSVRGMRWGRPSR